MSGTDPATMLAKRLALQHRQSMSSPEAGPLVQSPFIGADVSPQASVLPQSEIIERPQALEASETPPRQSCIHDLGVAAISKFIP